MKRILFILLAVVVLSGRAQEPPPATSPLDAYMETGMEVEDVRVPYYDENGQLQAQLHGGHAKVLEGGVADITNLRIDVYQNGVVVMTVFAPQCFTKMVEKGPGSDQKSLSVYSKGDVLIELETMTISGRGFRFFSEDNRFEILNDSKVLVKVSARKLKGVKP